MNEHEKDRILHHIIVERPIDIFDLINQYVEIIYEQRNDKNYKDILEEYLTYFAEEINEIASDQLILEQMKFCGQMLNKKEYYD